jgi:hypothetical protein
MFPIFYILRKNICIPAGGVRDLQVNSCRTKEVFLEETLLKKGFFQTIFPKLLISYCNLISGNL